MDEQNRSDLLHGQELIKEYGFNFPYTQQIIRNPTIGDPNQDIDPLNKAQSVVRTYDLSDAEAQLEAYLSESPGTQQISLPDKLNSITLYWSGTTGDGTAELDPQSFTTSSANILTKVKGSANASAAIDGDILPNRDAGYQGPAKATVFTFFRLASELTEAEIEAVTGADWWPVTRPKEAAMTIFGYQNSLRVGGTIAYSYGAAIVGMIAEIEEQSTDRSNGLSIKTITIPPSLHGAITPTVVGTDTYTAEAEVTSTEGGLAIVANAEVIGAFAPATIPATTPTSFPTGSYIYDVSSSPFMFGYLLVRVTVVHVTAEMV